MTVTGTYQATTQGLSARMVHFMNASRERGAHQPPDTSIYYRDFDEAYQAIAPEIPSQLRHAQAQAVALVNSPVYLFPDERLVGMTYHLGPRIDYQPQSILFHYGSTVQEKEERLLPGNAELVELGPFFGGGAFPGHVTWHWDWVLEKGINGLLGEYRQALANPRDEQAAIFFQAVITALESVLEWNERHLATLRERLAQAEADDAARLKELLALCERVPAYPARTFHEAVQSFYFQYLAVMRENPYGGNGPGRLDYFLWPYLERDLTAGCCTLQEARELIDELFVRIHERVQELDGWVETIVVGGSHPDGSSAVNPLSYIMVESIMALDQTHPAVYIRMPAEPPQEFIDLATHFLLHGKNRAQILNDPEIVTALERNGMAGEDAAMYTCGGCMEIVPQGMNSDLLFAAVHNVPKTVELVITGGGCLRTGKRLAAVKLPSLTAYATFDALYAAFAGEMERQLLIQFQRLDLWSAAMASYRPALLLSSLLSDCLARGREMHDGGARYHDYGATPLGIPNAGDALYAIKRAVFDDRLCSAETLLAALHADFAGYEDLRLQLRALPKYGQQHADADAMTDRVLSTVCDLYAAFRNRWDGRVKPIIFTFVWAPPAGAVLGATADGQFAGKPIAHGLTPQNAAMTEGITAAIGSHASLTLEKVAGASSTMWDLDPQWASPATVRALLTGFLQLGGQIFQGNMTPVDDLLKAKMRPEDYPNLIVRVGGFSSRFVALDPDVQDEIITRYRHAK